ncbi:MAG: M48 family metallopeptidase [Gammaproteobacteria bacterium]
MDFFQAQIESRRHTRRLVALYLLATLAVAAAVTAILGTALWWIDSSSLNGGPGWLIRRSSTLAAIAAGVIAFIGIASLYRILALRDGGSRIAREMGATPVPPDTQDPLRRKLRNVVEEMSIASGVPVPEIFVLEREPGINAFAAGYGPEDAAVAVTRGTLEQLNRDELQGVIAHEFSHILNGDMRLNIRLMGPLFGITVIGLVGRSLMRNARFSRRSRSRGGGGIVILALGLAVIGYVGVLFARMIKAGVSRQREYLADASAVQFTRQADGISGALKKILDLSEHSYLQRAESEEVSHMLFARGARLASLFATHPPLPQRISRLDPAWKTKTESQAKKSAGSGAGSLPNQTTAFALAPADPVTLVGNPGPEALTTAHTLHRQLPPLLYDAAHSNQGALLLVPALVLHPDAIPRRQQLSYLQGQLGSSRTATVEELFAEVTQAGRAYRLPLLDLSFPALRNRPDAQLEYLQDLVNTLVHADGRVELFEYALARLLDTAITRLRQPISAVRGSKALSSDKHGDDLRLLFAALAVQGHPVATDARTAWAAGLNRISPELTSGREAELPITPGTNGWQDRLDKAMEKLLRTRLSDRRRIIEALTVTTLHDGRITVEESELLRVVCATLDCPLPPLYAEAARRARESD